jgi:hypothetical protein
MATPQYQVQSIEEEDEEDEAEVSACKKDVPAETSARNSRKRGRPREVVAESCARHKSARSAGIVARRREQANSR